MINFKKKNETTNEFNQVIVGNSLTKEAWKRLRKNKMAVAGLVIVILFSLTAALAPILPIYPYDESVLDHQDLRPTLTKTAGDLMMEQEMKGIFSKAWRAGRLVVSDEENQMLEAMVLDNNINGVWTYTFEVGMQQVESGEYVFSSSEQRTIDKMLSDIENEIQISIDTVFALDETGKKINLEKADYDTLLAVYADLLGLDPQIIQESIDKEVYAQINNTVRANLGAEASTEDILAATEIEIDSMKEKDLLEMASANIYGKIVAAAKKSVTKSIDKEIENGSADLPYKGHYETDEGLIADIEANLMHSRKYLLGTDYLGRDLLSRIIYGGQVSIAIGLIGTITSVLLGILVGALAGYLGGKVDYYLMRFVDIMYGLPYMLLVIICMALVGRKISTLFFALALVSWLTVARMVRGQVMSLKNQEYVEAARSMGGGTFHIILKHMVPNAISVIIVYSTIRIPAFIMQESFLSFLGLGVQAPYASWGSLIGDGSKLGTMTTYPWQLIGPSLAMIVFLFSMNFLGDGLRDAFDPQSKNQL